MTIKDLLNEVIHGDDDVEITIKRTVPDDEDEPACECEDTCPIDIDDIDDTPLEEKEFKNFKEFIDFLTSIDDDDDEDDEEEEVTEDELKEYENDAKKAYLEAINEKGQEKADALLKISEAKATIEQAMKEKLPLREEDFKTYNDALKLLLDPPDFLVDLKYFLIDKANKEALATLKK